MLEDFYITRFDGIYFSPDPGGSVIKMIQRRSACFIVTVKGRISFEYEGGSVCSSPEQSVFLPAGFSYTNRCLQDAQSYVFNFQTSCPYTRPLALAPLSPVTARDAFDRIAARSIPYGHDHLAVMAELYQLAGLLCRQEDLSDGKAALLRKAMEYLTAHYSERSLSNREIAEACFISEVYLRKLFMQMMHKTPHRVLTELRMKQAQLLLHENFAVKDVALRVGYGDASQFCRAYKKFFGQSPRA